jgi:ubiquinone/menaquinone biosynthesis C-methylase UbiE
MDKNQKTKINTIENMCRTYSEHLLKRGKCIRCGYIPKKIILNLGSGIGIYHKAHALTWGRNAYYVNVDSYMDIEKLKKGAKTKKGTYMYATYEDEAEFIKADIRKLPFPDNYADGAEMHQVIEHFSWWEVIPALKEICRVLKKGGSLLLSTPNFNALAKEWVENCWLEEYLVEKHNTFNLDSYINLNEQIFGNQRGELGKNQGELHRSAMNPRFLQYALTRAGFKHMRIEAWAEGSLIPRNTGMPSKNRKGIVYRCETIIVRAKK